MASRPRRRASTHDSEVAFLCDPRSYPGHTRRVKRVATHFADVFLTDREAYKLKKPVRQARMNYRTVAARARGCRAEYELNQPMAPGVYRAVVPLTARGGAFELGGPGRVIDWLVRMRRLPARAMLEQRLRDATLDAAALQPVAQLLASFYADAQRAPMSPLRYLARIERGRAANARALARFGSRIDQALLAQVSSDQRDLAAQAGMRLGARGAHVVDAHGDLRAQHVCLSPLAIIDRIEFSRDLRLLDPYEDLALLMLEMEIAGRADLAANLRDRVGRLMSDPASRWLTHFYISRRAVIRARLAAWHVTDPRYPRADPWLALADTLLRRAQKHVRLAFDNLGAPLTRSRRPVEIVPARVSPAGS